MSEPIHYQLDEAAFDLTLLPENARTIGSSAFRTQVQAFFEQQCRGLSGETTVLFENGKISVTWIPKAADEDPRAAVLALLQSGRYDEAKPLLETALQANPRDHDALYNLGMVYSDEGRFAEAVQLLRRATERLAATRFRVGAGKSVRPGAPHYCLDALERFDGMARDTLMPIVMEMANLGQGGLPVNDPTKKFRLQLLPGEFSAHQLVCMMHVGLKQIDPSLDSGFDIAKEYAAAQWLRSGPGGRDKKFAALPRASSESRDCPCDAGGSGSLASLHRRQRNERNAVDQGHRRNLTYLYDSSPSSAQVSSIWRSSATNLLRGCEFFDIQRARPRKDIRTAMRQPCRDSASARS